MTLSVMSFFAGLAGDFSRPPPVSGATVVVRIPPLIPAGAPRAMPLPSLPGTAAASAQSLPQAVIVQAPPLGPVGPGAEMLLDHEVAHSAGDSAYAATSERFG